jgi:hypothetical protein
MASLEKLLVISSDDKDNPSDSNSDFSVTLKESYYTQNVLRVLVKEVTIPNVFPNIRGSAYGSNQNNTLNINDGSFRTITLPEGQYLINSSNPLLDFTTILQNALNAVSTSTFVVSYNELTNKIEFEVTAGVPVVLFSSSPPFGVPTSNMAETLGITSNIQILVGNTESSQEQLDLSGIQNVYVHSKEIADTHGIDGDSGLIALVDPVNLSNAPYGSYAYKQENDDELASIVYEDVRNLSRIRIILRDNLGNRLPIGTHKMNIVLKIYLASG